jgi:hypothetical protein
LLFANSNDVVAPLVFVVPPKWCPIVVQAATPPATRSTTIATAVRRRRVTRRWRSRAADRRSSRVCLVPGRERATAADACRPGERDPPVRRAARPRERSGGVTTCQSTDPAPSSCVGRRRCRDRVASWLPDHESHHEDEAHADQRGSLLHTGARLGEARGAARVAGPDRSELPLGSALCRPPQS